MQKYKLKCAAYVGGRLLAPGEIVVLDDAQLADFPAIYAPEPIGAAEEKSKARQPKLARAEADRKSQIKAPQAEG